MRLPGLLPAVLLIHLTTAVAAPPERRQRPTADVTPAAGREAAEQTQDAAPDDEAGPPVKKKDFTPASSLLEALHLSSREDRHTDKYLEQAKQMLAATPAAAGVAGADERGRTALHWAMIGAMYADKKQLSAYVDLTESLLTADADANAEDAYGNTPLDYQEMSASQEMLELLLEAGGRHGNGQNELAQLTRLLRNVSAAAEANDVNKVRAALAADLPLGTTLPIKLTTPVSSNKNRAGDPVEAVVAAPIFAPAGSEW